jgi:uncharacterized protein YeaO (DUF488 family)
MLSYSCASSTSPSSHIVAGKPYQSSPSIYSYFQYRFMEQFLASQQKLVKELTKENGTNQQKVQELTRENEQQKQDFEVY